jgi:hypothetical protein
MLALPEQDGVPPSARGVEHHALLPFSLAAARSTEGFPLTAGGRDSAQPWLRVLAFGYAAYLDARSMDHEVRQRTHAGTPA